MPRGLPVPGCCGHVAAVGAGGHPGQAGVHGLARQPVTSARNWPQRTDSSYDRRAAYGAAAPLIVCQIDQL
jgi:hypothetical protein